MRRRRHHRRNAPMSRAEKRALLTTLLRHNPRRRRRKLTKAQRRLIALRNLRKARRARRPARSLRSRRALSRWASGQIGKHNTGTRGYVIINRYGIRRRAGRKVKLPGLKWSGKKGTVAFRGRHHDPDFYAGSSEEFDTMFTNPRRIVRRGGKRFVVIARKDGRKIRTVRRGRVTHVSQLRFRVKSRKHRTPRHLRKFLFKAGSARLHRALAKARRGWAAWRRRQVAKRR